MTAALKARLGRPDILLAPGVYDGLTALLADQAGPAHPGPVSSGALRHPAEKPLR
jgi:2-methylisocitrate lyase-like PEP mutase family enzyme